MRIGKVRRSVGTRAVAEPMECRRLLAAQTFAGEGPLVDGYTTAVATADFNADGRRDFAALNNNGTVDRVYLGLGDGSFTAGATFNPGGADSEMLAADFNGDGKTDLVGLGSSTNAVYVILGTGTGTFGAPTTTAVGADPRGIATADFNGDGKRDLVTANTAANTLSVAMGNGNGTFAPAASIAVPTAPVSVATADFNGDGKIDLAATGSTDGVSILLGHGNGTFAAPVLTASGSKPIFVLARDLNNDSRPDLVLLGAAFSGAPGLTIALNRGDGTFAARGYALGEYWHLDATDFNGDGYLDLAGDGVMILNAGDGTFLPAANAIGIPSGSGVVADDFNADGRADLLVTSYTRPAVASVLIGDGSGAFAPPPLLSLPRSAIAVVAADFDDDGNTDLVSGDYSFGTLYLNPGRGDGRFDAGVRLPDVDSFAGMITADFNGDGRTDLAAAGGYSSGFVTVLLNTGNRGFTAVQGPGFGVRVAAMAAADFNRDGITDLALILNNATTLIRLGLGNGTFYTAQTLAVAGQGVAAGDFNADGKPDLAFTGYVSSSAGKVMIYLGNGIGGFTAGATPSVGPTPTGIVVADFNNDGKADIATSGDDSNGTLSLTLGNGNGTFGTTRTVSAGSYLKRLVAADFNGDGFLDLASLSNQLPASPAWLATGTGTGGLNPVTAVPTILSGSIPVAGDFDGDGKPDLVIASPSNTDFVVLRNRRPDVSHISAASGVLSVNGTGEAVTVGRSNGVLTISTPGGVDRRTAASVRTLVLNGVTATVASDLGGIDLAVGENASVALAVSQHLRGLSVNGSVALAAGGTKVLRTATLSLGVNGRLDLNNNGMILDYAGTSPWQQAVRGWIAAGRAGGSWTGPGLVSSSARADASQSTTLGYVEASDYRQLYGATATLMGEAIDATAVLVRYTLYGDADLDGGVSVNDFNRLSAAFGRAGQTWLAGDFDGDDNVSIADFNLLAGQFGKRLPSPLAAVRGPLRVVRR